MVTLEEKQEWERVRAAGYNQYLLSTIVREGIPEGIIGTLLALLINYARHQPFEGLWKILPVLGTFILGLGWVRGMMSWRENEGAYVEAEGLDHDATDHSDPSTKQSNVAN